jgi:hypothetical protein
MKKIILLFLLLTTNCASQTEEDTITLPINPLNNCELRYDFYPNYNAYYDWKKQIFIVNKNGVWVEMIYIPSNYKGYSLYNKTHYTIKDYDGDDITNLYPIHKKKFPYATRKTLLKEW